MKGLRPRSMPSSRRKPGSSLILKRRQQSKWIPAFAGMTECGAGELFAGATLNRTIE